MPTLETPPPPPTPPTPAPEPVKVRTGRFGELEEHELIHLIDSLDDERARARFRESIYISIFIWIFLAWLFTFGLRFLPQAPRVANAPIKEEHGQIAQLDLPKDLQRELARQPHPAPVPPRPQPPVMSPQPAPAPQPKTQPQPTAQPQPQPIQPRANTPQPPAPTPPPAPRPQQQAMVDAPRPSFQQPTQSVGSALQEAARAAARQGGASGPTGITGGGRSPLGSGAEILTDTQGVDFGPWMRRFRSDVYRNWTPLIPESVLPPISRRGIVGIRITILKGGQIANVVRETPSGDTSLDKAAWNALTSEGTYPQLPREFPGPSIELRCTFLYNEELDGR